MASSRSSVHRFESRLLLLCLGLACVAPFLSTSVVSAEDPDAQCTEDRSGLPACNFNNDNCFEETFSKRKKQGWLQAKSEEDGPLGSSPFNDTYIYLSNAPTRDPREISRDMVAGISKGKSAICVDFYYASTEKDDVTTKVPLSFVLKEGGSESVMYEMQIQTRGEWRKAEFHCCLPNLQGKRELVVRGTSYADSMLALDHLDIVASNMTCENDRLVCYPRPDAQLPLEPADDSHSCPGPEETRAKSCDFISDDKNTTNFCNWLASEGWVAKQKYDGSGVYDVVQSTAEEDGRPVFMITVLDKELNSLCVEVEFAMEDPTADLNNAFTLHMIDTSTGEYMTWAESYSYDGDAKTEWKRLSQAGCVPYHMTLKQFGIRANVKGLKINYIHMRQHNDSRCGPPPTQKSIEDLPGMLFSCSSSAALSLCGLTGLPKATWREVTFRSSEYEPVFTGAVHYMYVKGNSKTIPEPVRLSTGDLTSERETILQFSYNMKGPADITVSVHNVQTGIVEEVLKTNQETNLTWVSREAPIKTLGQFRIVFEVVGSDFNSTITSNETFTVGFTDITVRFVPVVAPKESDKKDGATEPGSDENEGGGGSGSNAGVIVGSIFAVLAVVALVGAGVWYFYFRNRGDESPRGCYVESGGNPSSQETNTMENVMYSTGGTEAKIQ